MGKAVAEQPGAIEEECQPLAREVGVVAREATEFFVGLPQRRAESQQAESRCLLKRDIERLPRRFGGGGESAEQQLLDGASQFIEGGEQLAPVSGVEVHSSSSSNSLSASSNVASIPSTTCSVRMRSKTRKLACARNSAAAAVRS